MYEFVLVFDYANLGDCESDAAEGVLCTDRTGQPCTRRPPRDSGI